MMAEKKNDMIKGYQLRKRRWRNVTAVLFILVLVLAVTMLLYGNTKYSFSVALKVLMGENIQGATFAIKTLRLPRMLGGLLAGLAFGIAGSTFQTLLRNPLASPDIIGVTSGSSVAAVFCILMLRLSGSVVSVAAVTSGILVAGIIYLLSYDGGFSKGRLILIGIGAQAMLNAVISYLLLKSSQYDVSNALRWLSGSLNGILLGNIPRLAVVVLVFGTAIVMLRRHLEAMQLGEEYAVTLGVKTKVISLVLIVCSVFLIAFATSVTGPIASIAFLSGPIASRLTGNGRSNTIPAGLMGAFLVLAGDLVGQFLLPARYPVGVVTGILGAPYMLYLLIRMNRKGENV